MPVLAVCHPGDSAHHQVLLSFNKCIVADSVLWIQICIGSLKIGTKFWIWIQFNVLGSTTLVAEPVHARLRLRDLFHRIRLLLLV